MVKKVLILLDHVIDSDLQYAVYESLQLRGTDPNKFNASLGELF